MWDRETVKAPSWVDCATLLMQVSPLSIRFTTKLNHVGQLSTRTGSKLLSTITLEKLHSAQEHKGSPFLPAVGLSD